MIGEEKTMNEIYNKILKILKVEEFDDVEFLECFL